MLKRVGKTQIMNENISMFSDSKKPLILNLKISIFKRVENHRSWIKIFRCLNGLKKLKHDEKLRL